MFLLIGLIIVTIATSVILWLTHISMVMDDKHKYPYGWAGYRKFKENFHKHEWKHDTIFRGSLFGTGIYGLDYLHASIFRFNGRGMIMRTPIDYLLSEIYIKRYIWKNHREKTNKIKW